MTSTPEQRSEPTSVATEEEAARRLCLLADEPLSGAEGEEALFGHGGVAETLEELVTDCPTPFTIGLYGKWGTGKSSVVGLLRERLSLAGVPTVLIDVWKYQDDCLRRVVLKEMDKQGRTDYQRYSKQFALDERVEIETSLSQQFKLGFGIGKSRLGKFMLAMVLLLFIGASAVAAVFPAQVGPVVASIVAGVSTALASLAVVAVILSPKTRTFSQGKYSDPYEFESEFLRVLGEGFSQADRVLVVFDNLDRVSEDKAVEVLATVKTFLETKPIDGSRSKTIFLIPCDDDAIRRQVQKRFKDTAKNDEFLRKFFNVSLRLPEFISAELEEYTGDLLRRSNLPQLDDPRIAWMIAKAFRDNPRQVKQFVNVLAAEYALVVRRQGSGELPEGFAEEHALELTLFLLLRSRFPTELQALVDAEKFSLTPDALAGDSALERFVKQIAREATIADVRDWLTLRRSSHEVALPGVGDFLLALQDGDVDSARPFMSGTDGSESTTRALSWAVQERLGAINNPTAFVTALDALLQLLGAEGRSLQPTTYGELCSKTLGFFASAPELSVTRVDPDLLAEKMLLELGPEYIRPFVQAWAAQLGRYAQEPEKPMDNRFLRGLASVLSRRAAWFDADKSDIKTALATCVADDEEVVGILISGEKPDAWVGQAMMIQFAESFGEV